jgi:putative membrane protein
MRRLALALLLTGGGVALAQTSVNAQNPAVQDEQRAANPHDVVAPTKGDEVFAHQAAAGGMAEVQLSQLAMDRASSTEVKTFARKMVEDHSKANTELKQIAEKQKMALPDKIDAKHQKLYDKLTKLSGAEFDQEYMKAMMSDHDETVAKFKNESLYGQDPALKSFAMKTLPVIEKHDTMAHDDAGLMKK